MVQIKIGSAPGNNVVLNHPTVAPFHLEILQDDKGNFLLTDLNSLYGTTVNGYRIQGMVQLRPTDIVKAGEVVLPWNTYFPYQQPVMPPPSMYPPVGGMMQNPAYTTPVAAPVVEKPRNKKKIAMIVGGSILGTLLVIVFAIYMYTRPSYAHLKLIPSEAFLVVSADLKSISGKIDMEKMQKLDFFMDMKQQSRGSNDAFSKVLSDPMSSGIDIFSQPYAFVTVENSERTRFTGGVVFAIKNESNFRTFMQRLSRDESIKKSDKFSLVRMEDGLCVAWNDDAGVILFSDKSKTRTENYCRSLFEQSEKESMLSVETFKKFKGAKYDVGFFVNYDALHGIPGVTIPSYMNGSASMATINFNDGKLSYANEYLSDSPDSIAANSVLSKKGINAGLQATIPGKSYGIASLSLNLNELYKFMDRDPKMSDMLTSLGYSLNVDKKKLPSILGGDFYASLSDVKQMPVSRMSYDYDYDLDTYTMVERIDTMLMPSYILAGNVKDKTALEGIIARTEPKDTLHGIRFYTSYRSGNFYIANSGANYFFTNDYTVAVSLASGQKAAVQVSGPMAALIANGPIYSYFNLNLPKYPPMLSTYLERAMGDRDFNDFETVFNVFDYFELTGEGAKQNFDVYFIDKGNCLNTLLEMGNDLYLNHRR